MTVVEFCCVECKAKITRGPDGTEYGHRRYGRTAGKRCSRRPDSVDPNRSCSPRRVVTDGGQA
jgi:hypothetical protein